MKLFESIGRSIAKAKGAPAAEESMDVPADDESTESPGAMLAEALGLKSPDIEGIDAALKAAVEQFGA